MDNKFQDPKFFPDKLNLIPAESGVYSFYDDSDNLIYIGKAKDLKKRISSYFSKNHTDSKTRQLISKIHHIRVTTVKSEIESLLLEAKLIRLFLPKYNVIWKDDKHYIYIKVTKEEFPRILFARKEDDLTSNFYGPFPSSFVVRDLLRYLRRIFPYCTQNRNIKRSCFYSHIGLCSPCPGEIVKTKDITRRILTREYNRNVNQIKLILNSKFKRVKSILADSMVKYSKEENFEKAAEFRDKIERINFLLTDYHNPDLYIKDPYFAGKSSLEDQKELSQILSGKGLSIKSINKIECFDISNISGKMAVGSMVVFIDGKSSKANYRRFRIKLKSTPDDFAMISEVLNRRLNHKEWKFPDLFIIDGGKPQLLALSKIFNKYNIKIPYIGIAKEFEELVLPPFLEYRKIRLPSSSGALHLVERIRDEAHRFAHKYHEKVRLDYLLGKVIV